MKNKIGAVIKLYKTRKPLQNLLDFIPQGIGRATTEAIQKLNNDQLFNLTVSHFCYLLKGG